MVDPTGNHTPVPAKTGSSQGTDVKIGVREVNELKGENDSQDDFFEESDSPVSPFEREESIMSSNETGKMNQQGMVTNDKGQNIGDIERLVSETNHTPSELKQADISTVEKPVSQNTSPEATPKDTKTTQRKGLRKMVGAKVIVDTGLSGKQSVVSEKLNDTAMQQTDEINKENCS